MVTDSAKKAGHFVSVTSTDFLDELFQRSHDSPVILFKHSLTCPISSLAYHEIQKVSHEVSLVVIQESRDISAEIANRTGIRHESPQVIVVRNGAAVWNASHWSIAKDAIESAVREYE